MRVSLARALVALVLLTCGSVSQGAVLPEDRADALYHSYDGGGVEVDGPFVLVRKQIGQSFSLSGGYYVDYVTSASIDVLSQGSPYTEERTQTDLSVDYLREKTIMTLAYTNSEESDYVADTYSFSISQDMFGDLTTVTLGYSNGRDKVGKNIKLGGSLQPDPSFSETVQRQNYRVGVSQVLTKSMIAGFSWETITDEGFLNNPYRSVRYVDSTPRGYSFEPEAYPNTRTSNAAALRLKYFLPYRAALHGEYRFYNDDWGIKSGTGQLAYTHPFGRRWVFDLKVRAYSQTAADFYSDLFPYQNAQNFLARDKELSTFSSLTLGGGASYEFLQNGWGFIDRGSVNMSFDRIQFDYEDFRDITVDGYTPGTEPAYSFSANVIKLYASFWY